MTVDRDIVIDEGDLKTLNNESGSISSSSIHSGSRDRRSRLQGFGDSFSSIKDVLSVGSIQEDIAFDDHNATFNLAEVDASHNDPDNVQALIDGYFAKLESKRASAGFQGKTANSTSTKNSIISDDFDEEDAKQIDDLNQVESYFNRIDSRTKLTKSGRRAVRSRRKKNSGSNDDLLDKFLGLSLKNKKNGSLDANAGFGGGLLGSAE